MGSEGGETKLTGPDLAEGVAAEQVPDGGVLLGHAAGEAVILARRGAEVFAVGATCSHYGGPLAEGLVVGDEVRCPLHHACFSLRTGEAVRAPALNAIACFDVTAQGGKLYVLGKRDAATVRLADAGPASVVIVGAGPAGNACAEALRRARYAGPIALIGAEATGPVDSSEPLEGLPRRHRPRGVAPAPRRGFLSRARGRAADEHARRLHRRRAQARDAGRGRVAPLRRARARDGRATGEAADRRHRPPSRVRAPHPGRQPGDPREGGRIPARGARGSGVHRPRGGGEPPRARPRGARRGPRGGAAGARDGRRDWRLREEPSRGARSAVSPRRGHAVDRGGRGRARERRAARGGPRGGRRRGAARRGARRTGRAEDRSRDRRRRATPDERARRVGDWRRGALARIRGRARRFAWSTGWWPSVWGSSPPGACSVPT